MYRAKYAETGVNYFAVKLMTHAVAAQADCAGLGHDVPAGTPGPGGREGQFVFQIPGREVSRSYVLEEADYPIWNKLWGAADDTELSPALQGELTALVEESLQILGAAK